MVSVNDVENGALSGGSLDGIRVLDLGQAGAAPYLASLLGDMGADVIKVEPPGGERFRYVDNLYGPGESGYFFGINRSKRSVVLDVKTDTGRSALMELIRTTDVFLISMRPSTILELELDYDSLAPFNPQMIYCSVSAYGETGPRAEQAGMDILAQALSGLMGTTGEPGRTPVKCGPPVADFATAYLGGFAICAALLARARTGEGQKVTLSLLDSALGMLVNYVTPFFHTNQPIRPVGGGHPHVVPMQVFEAADGYFVIACPSEKFWPPLCKAIGLPHLAEDARFTTNSQRVAHRDELISQLVPLFLEKPRAHWLGRLERLDVPCCPVNYFEEIFEDPQVRYNEMLVELQHPVFGKYTTVRHPVRMSRTPPGISRPTPALGTDTREVLEELGLDRETIDNLLEQAAQS